MEREVGRAENRTMLLAPDTLLSPLAIDPGLPPLLPARRCAALRPSLIAIAARCLEMVCPRGGSGTNPARSGMESSSWGGNCNFAIVAAISVSPGAYLSARYWYCRAGGQRGENERQFRDVRQRINARAESQDTWWMSVVAAT